MSLLEFIIFVSFTTNLVTAVALKYGIHEWYLRQKTASWLPEYFCLLCFAFWTGLATSIIVASSLDQPFLHIVFATIITPTVVVTLHK